MGQGRVQHGAGMALGKKKTVALGPIRPAGIDLQVVKIEGGHDFSAGERPADVPGLIFINHFQHIDAELVGFGGDVAQEGFRMVHRLSLFFQDTVLDGARVIQVLLHGLGRFGGVVRRDQLGDALVVR